ncbi:hypothetical protein CVT26_011463 [Gymnopilus dilepis]|uniref:Uncharacterized protein n=1 Tax=Gymnopilus dilepis TaxID=231916 RepID=A0A409VXU9_9AGAR|nr:hypothetical protein CVT26_011463 [Gymnopilus dilepis]
MALSDYDTQSQYSSSETEVDDDSEDDYVAPGKRKRQQTSVGRKAKVKAPPKLGYIAEVTESANDGINNSEETASVSVRGITISLKEKIFVSSSTEGRQPDCDSFSRVSPPRRLTRGFTFQLERIRKALALANHPGTGEEEAKRAMRMAMKMMTAENVTQADLIANETAEERSTRAGHSTVSIRSTQGKSVRHQRWYHPASEAACEAFDVQLYNENYGRYLNYVFYGLADNTVAAALSFEMLHNQIETWALERKRERKLKGQIAGNSYRLGVARRVLTDAQQENRDILRKAQAEEKKRVKEEEEARAAEIARLDGPIIPEVGVKVEEEEDTPLPKAAPKVEEVPDEAAPAAPPIQQSPDAPQKKEGSFPRVDLPMISITTFSLSGNIETDNKPSPAPVNFDDLDDSDDDDNGNGADFDFQDEGAHDFDIDALEKEIKARAEEAKSPISPPRQPSPPPRTPTPIPVIPPKPKAGTDAKEEADPATGPSWTSALQLRTFKDNAKTIAEDYIKSTGLKLTKGRKLGKVQHDTRAFNMGWDDGRKVDLKRRRIEDEMIREFKVEED